LIAEAYTIQPAQPIESLTCFGHGAGRTCNSLNPKGIHVKSLRPILYLAAFVLLPCLDVVGQSTQTLSETVNQRHTLGILTASPTTGLTAGETITFSYILGTAGAPAPTSETVQFTDGASAIGTAQTIGVLSGSNLLPNSHISIANGWTLAGISATVTANAVNGPDGGTSNATQVAFPSTSPGNSSVQMAVAGTAYASQPMTFSVWAQSASATTLTLSLADSPAVAASSSTTCAVTSTWQRCSFTYTFPANAGTGFAASLSSTGLGAQTINLWGAQVEQASAASTYVSTIGTARPTGGQGGSATLSYSLFTHGTHTITGVYAGDSNFVASTSNSVVLVFGQATPGITLTASPVTPGSYGQSITFTATLTGPAADPTDLPTGSVQFFDGATSLGTGTIGGSGTAVATVTLSGVSSLGAGTHSITAVYSGDTEFNAVTSTALPCIVNKASASVTIVTASSLNPATYGDSVTFTMAVASSIGAAIPTGSVSVSDGGTSLGTVTLNGAGSGTLTVPLFTAGTHTLTITYSGDANYN
jgi:hypothetical protein